MRGVARVREWLRGLTAGGREEREMEEEIRFHLDMEVEKNRNAGMPEPEARRAARLAFGWTEWCKAEVARARGTAWVGDLGQDARHGWRLVRRAPGFATVVVLTLALGIGANTAVFSVVDGVLLRPLPYPESDRLVRIQAGMSVGGEFLLVRERSRSFSEVGVVHLFDEVSISGDGDPVRVPAGRVSPELLPMLGVSPQLGRPFTPEEFEPGGARVALIGAGIWQQRYGSERDVVGRSILLDGVPHDIVGVLPSGFEAPGDGADVWLPARFAGLHPGELWGSGGYFMIGRLGPGVDVETARRELAALAGTVREAVPWQMPDDYWRDVTVTPLRDAIVGDVRAILLVLLASVGLVLLIACANVANLFMARSAGRVPEMAVRTALGAGRWRITRQLLTESAVLTLLSALVGLLLAWSGTRALISLLPGDLPRAQEVALDLRVVAFAIGISCVTGLLFGLGPALRTGRGRWSEALREGARGSTGAGEQRVAAGLVVVQLALAVVLVTGAGLMIRSLDRLLEVDPGFRPAGLVTASVAPVGARYPTGEARREFYQRLGEELDRRPFEASALASGLPFHGDAFGSVFVIEGRPDPARESGQWPWADARVSVSTNYFATLGVPLLSGRVFTETDRADAEPVAVISRSLARQYWPDEDVVGRRIRFPGDTGWRTVVGVVADVRWSNLAVEPETGLFLPLAQSVPEAVRVLVRERAGTTGAALVLTDAVRAADPEVPAGHLRTMERAISASTGETRSAVVLLSLFAATALTLGGVGIYGVVSYAVRRRSREFGIRLALGAHAGQIVGMVLRRGAALALFGIVPGLLLAGGATRLLSGLLFGVSALDPVTFATVPLVLAALALLAAYLPARRVARIDPVSAMRAE